MSSILSGSAGSDPFSILEQEHQEVDELFDEYSQSDDDIDDADDLVAVKLGLVREICQKLTLHSRIEEEVVYPELRAAIDPPELIAQLESMEPDDPEMDRTVETVAQCIRAHVVKEENAVACPGNRPDSHRCTDASMQASSACIAPVRHRPVPMAVKRHRFCSRTA